MTTDGPLFAFEHVCVDGPRGPLVRDVDGTIPSAGITSVVGPSGAGKSTLLRLCNRLVVPTGGVVRFHGDDVAALDPLALRRRVGMVFQRPTPFGGTVRDNLLVARPDLDETGACEALEHAALDATFLDRPASELSGGESQRMCLARTLVTRPEVLLMDEPTSALDPQARTQLEGLARTLAREGKPVVWVSHDLGQMRRIADHVIVMLDGVIAHAAPLDALERDASPPVAAFLRDPGTESP